MSTSPLSARGAVVASWEPGRASGGSADDDAVAPAAFGGVEEVVNAAEQRGEVGRRRVGCSDAEADRHRHWTGAGRDWLRGDLAPQPLGDLVCTEQVGLRQDDDEFFPTVAPEDIHLAQAVAEPVGHRTEDLVAH